MMKPAFFQITNHFLPPQWATSTSWFFWILQFQCLDSNHYSSYCLDLCTVWITLIFHTCIFFPFNFILLHFSKSLKAAINGWILIFWKPSVRKKEPEYKNKLRTFSECVDNRAVWKFNDLSISTFIEEKCLHLVFQRQLLSHGTKL